MNALNPSLTPLDAGPWLPVPLYLFEVTEMVVPVRQPAPLTEQDRLREDKDLTEGCRHTTRPARWSALNDF